MARVESSAQELHPVSISADLLVRDAVQAMSGLVQDAEAVLEIGETTASHVFADADAVVQVLRQSHRKRHQVRYQPARGSRPRRRQRPTCTEPSEAVEFRVQDFGSGIASEHLERIFDAFTVSDKAPLPGRSWWAPALDSPSPATWFRSREAPCMPKVS